MNSEIRKECMTEDVGVMNTIKYLLEPGTYVMLDMQG